MRGLLVILLGITIACGASAEDDYPDMVGVWKAKLRTISSGHGQVAAGGMVISEEEATVTIDFQDREVFLGKVRLASMTRDDPSVTLWGAIRSDGKEAQFIGSDGTRGPIWFRDDKSYEFCVTNLTAKGAMMGYCGVFRKQVD